MVIFHSYVSSPEGKPLIFMRGAHGCPLSKPKKQTRPRTGKTWKDTPKTASRKPSNEFPALQVTVAIAMVQVYVGAMIGGTTLWLFNIAMV